MGVTMHGPWLRHVDFRRSASCPGCDYMGVEIVKADDWTKADGFCTKCGKTWSTRLNPGSRQALEALATPTGNPTAQDVMDALERQGEIERWKAPPDDGLGEERATDRPREREGPPAAFSVTDRVIVDSPRYHGPGIVGQVKRDGSGVYAENGQVMFWEGGEWVVEVTPWIGPEDFSSGRLHSNTWRYPVTDVRPAHLAKPFRAE